MVSQSSQRRVGTRYLIERLNVQATILEKPKSAAAIVMSFWIMVFTSPSPCEGEGWGVGEIGRIDRRLEIVHVEEFWSTL